MSTTRWWLAWELDLPVMALLAGVTLLYLRGANRRRIGTGATPPDARRPAAQVRRRRRRTARFLTGVAVLLAAFVGPVAAFSVELMWVHMVQHLLVVVVAAPLLAWAQPGSTLRSALPVRTRILVARASRRPLRTVRRRPQSLLAATAAHAAALWVWHAPPLYDAAVESEAWHGLEHASFFLTALWFWTAVVSSTRREAGQHAIATLCLGLLIVQGGVLGALLTFPDTSLYASYDGAGALTALEDQQLAGALMWVPPGVFYAVVAIGRFAAWLRTSERDVLRREAREHGT